MAQGPAIGFISGITLPQGRIRIEGSNKSAKGIHVGDLAKYIDERRAATQKECTPMCKWKPGALTNATDFRPRD